MKRNALLLPCATLIIMISSPAVANTADDYLREVVGGLEDAPVYVAPGIPGTNRDTASELESKLEDGDGITLVMLPSEAAEQITDPQDFVAQVSSELGSDDIIGLTIGGEAVAYSEVLPKGKAAELMNRADSIATNDTETLIAFTRITHQWIDDHPAPALSGGGAVDSGGVFAVAAMLFVAAAAALGYIVFRRRQATVDGDYVNFEHTPEAVRRLLEEILDMRQHVEDHELQELLLACSRHVERYFAHNSKDSRRDAVVFKSHLGSVEEVLRKYLDIQNNSLYYDDPRRELDAGKAGIEGFADFVLRSCRNSSKAQLTRYTVNTQILDAQRYS